MSMTLPLVASGTPVSVDLHPDRKYLYCTCGRSDDQPFCDGSHQGTDLEPLAFQVEDDGPAQLCRCKQTADAPYCDGSHNAVPAERVGTEFRLDRSGGGSAAPSPQATEEEPHLEFIHSLARDGLSATGTEGPVAAMGVPRKQLPAWDDLQILTAQLARRPLESEEPVGTELVIGPAARKPLHLAIPLLITDMSFGALSEEAKRALALGAEAAGTAICSGEGGLLPEELEANHRALFELGPARYGFHEDLPERVQAFHFKAGQAAKTGVGGHLPAGKVSERIAAIRGIQAGRSDHSPATFTDLLTAEAFAAFAERIRERSGGIPVGFKMSAQHIEADIDFALAAGADYIILDGRGGGTGAAPLLFRDHISVPTIPALARARRHLERRGVRGRVTLIITGGLRTPADFVKALALGADGIALGNAAIQAIGCVGARICHTNRCPAGVATQDPGLRQRLSVDTASHRLATFLGAAVSLMQVMARACGHRHLAGFRRDDLTSWKKETAELAGVAWCGPAAVAPRDQPPSTTAAGIS